MYSRRSHASLPSQPVNRAVQYLRRLSQDPPTKRREASKQPTSVNQSISLISQICICMCFLLLAIYCCNKASNRIVPKQKDLVSSSGYPLSPEVSRLSPYTQAQQHMRTSRTFYIFAVHRPDTPPKITLSLVENLMSRGRRRNKFWIVSSRLRPYSNFQNIRENRTPYHAMRTKSREKSTHTDLRSASTAKRK